MIRKICCALLLLMAALPAAYAAQPLAVVPPTGDRRPAHSAVVCTSEETAPLYRLPDEESGVLMRYYGGAPVQVLRPAGGGFYRVQAGEPGAGVAGYMRVGDVELDAAAQRGVRPRYMELQFNREADVYAYCDAGAPVIGRCDTAHTYYAMGKSDGKWVQLYLPPQTHVWQQPDRITCGFVRLETGMARGYWHEPEEWEAEPLPGEITREQAIELAIDRLTGDPESAWVNSERADGMPGAYAVRSRLEQMDCRAFLRMRPEGEPSWWVYFWQQPQSDAVCVHIRAMPAEEMVLSSGYILSDDWPIYSIEPTL